MKRTKLYFLYLCGLTMFLAACSGGAHYRIGVLQCSEGNWRNKLNKEMLAAQHLFKEDVVVEILNCHDVSEVQVRQIDSLADRGVDILVVAPNEYAEVAAALKRTKEKGVPVILFDRKAESDDYTAFIGGDNRAVGRLAASYALELAKREGPGGGVLEIAALQSTSPAAERHAGFAETMAGHPEAGYRCIMGDWDDHHTGEILRKEIAGGRCPDVVFCHSDFMAMGAYRALKKAGLEERVKVIGVDGLPGPGEGIEAVQRGWLAGTCVYPTEGEKIIKLALDILRGRPYERENYLKGMMVTPENVDLVASYSEELMSQGDELVTIHDKLERYLGRYNQQMKVIWVGALAIVVLVVAVMLTWMAVRQLRRAQRKTEWLNREQKQFYTNASHQLKTPLTLIAGPVSELLKRGSVKEEDLELLEIAERNIVQMEAVVTNVLNFGKEKSAAAIADDTPTEILREESATMMEKEHLNLLKQDDAEELPEILVVDDNGDMRRYLRTLLGSRFYVLEAGDGQSGVRLARESVPDLIVSDVMMPVMDGLELCRRVKTDMITSHIPVILLTARSEERQQMEGYESGADAYLTKPFNAELLLSRIYNLLNSRRQLRRQLDGRQTAEAGEVKLRTQDRLFMEELKTAIGTHLGNANLKMDDLGEELGISRVQLYRKVKTLTGLSPVELLREMRLQRGMVLLNSTTKTVAEIAYEVGFNSPGYFSNCFKKQFGKLPMEMRSEQG